MNKSIKPIVSVAMITYGHEQLIKKAIEGVLMQEVDFSIELIVADDCSLDSTKGVVEDLIRNHPNGHWIQYTKHAQNKGIMSNFIWTLKQCRGEYIALCEGDDYWTDPLKLQKQVNFLQENKDCILSFHNVYKLYPNGKKVIFNEYKKTKYEGNDLWKQWLIPTQSMVFRNISYEVPEWFLHATHGDLGLQVLLGEHGKFGFINEIMAIYRIHEGGVTMGAFNNIIHYERHIKQLEGMNTYFDYKYDKYIHPRIVRYSLTVAHLNAKTRNKQRSLKYLKKGFQQKTLLPLRQKYLYTTILFLLIKW